MSPDAVDWPQTLANIGVALVLLGIIAGPVVAKLARLKEERDQRKGP